METALGVSKGTMISCPLFRNKEMGSSSISKCKMGCMNFALNDPSHKQFNAGTLKVYCGKTNKLEKQNLKKLADLHGGSLSDKRRMKLLKSLTEELRGQSLSDAMQVLMTQMEQEKAVYKQRKRAMKADKKGIKVQKKLQNKCEDESSSCDSISSVSECEASMTKIPEPPLITGDTISVTSMKENCSHTCGLYGEFAKGEKGERVGGVEVCMGGKCKKLGADQLLGAFEERMDISGMGCEVEVVSCKCMGKCRNAPNVRVNTDVCQELHMGVGIADVGFILDRHFGVEKEDELQSKDVVCV